jgi:hypothetical protein
VGRHANVTSHSVSTPVRRARARLPVPARSQPMPGSAGHAAAEPPRLSGSITGATTLASAPPGRRGASYTVQYNGHPGRQPGAVLTGAPTTPALARDLNSRRSPPLPLSLLAEPTGAVRQKRPHSSLVHRPSLLPACPRFAAGAGRPEDPLTSRQPDDRNGRSDSPLAVLKRRYRPGYRVL